MTGVEFRFTKVRDTLHSRSPCRTVSLPMGLVDDRLSGQRGRFMVERAWVRFQLPPFAENLLLKYLFGVNVLRNNHLSLDRIQ